MTDHRTDGDKRAEQHRREMEFLREYSGLCNRLGMRLEAHLDDYGDPGTFLCRSTPGGALIANDGGVWWQEREGE